MTRRLVLLVAAVAALLLIALASAAVTLRAYGPAARWNVFAAPTATPTSTATPTVTPTPTPTATPSPTPTLTPTPLPTATPTPAVPPPAPPPVPGAEMPGERWILVDLGAQTATAMVGDVPLYTALVTTGKDGWDTPIGSWRIEYRVENETMTSAAIGAEEYYVLEDVLYTQYFTNAGHALHLNYWREDWYFGRIRSSHGCVGMRYADAEFFWRFATHGTRVEIIAGSTVAPSI